MTGEYNKWYSSVYGDFKTHLKKNPNVNLLKVMNVLIVLSTMCNNLKS